ncbi:MAG TPA: cobalamin-dependent protein [Candidatus Krumholzibacteria bacterium]|nr:cobalamin-dependent protein [Candidatus Krumholzibacteria bacterium]
MLDRIRSDYDAAIFDTDRDQALQAVQVALDLGVDAEAIVFGVVVPSIERYLAEAAANQVSLAQHYLAAQIAGEVVEAMLPRFRTAPDCLGRVVIGTSLGDFHGLGKRIVGGCLKAHMFAVTDLGLNVSPAAFVDAAVAQAAHVIAISSMMVHTARGDGGCLGVRRILAERGLEDTIRVIVGGAPYRFDPRLYRQVGADAWAENGLAAAGVVRELLQEVAR